MQYRSLHFYRDVFFMKSFSFTDSTLCLVEWWAPVIQLNSVFASDALAFSVFETTVPRLHGWRNTLLHGIAAAIDVSNFRLAFLMMPLYSSSLGSIEQVPLKSLACSRFGFSIAHSCFSSFFERLSQFLSKRQAICDLDVMSFWIFVSLSPGPHISFWRSFVQ